MVDRFCVSIKRNQQKQNHTENISIIIVSKTLFEHKIVYLMFSLALTFTNYSVQKNECRFIMIYYYHGEYLQEILDCSWKKYLDLFYNS